MKIGLLLPLSFSSLFLTSFYPRSQGRRCPETGHDPVLHVTGRQALVL